MGAGAGPGSGQERPILSEPNFNLAQVDNLSEKFVRVPCSANFRVRRGSLTGPVQGDAGKLILYSKCLHISEQNIVVSPYADEFLKSDQVLASSLDPHTLRRIG